MTHQDLIPELALWNEGQGISREDWIWISGLSDHALAFTSLFWPRFAVMGDYVLRAPVDTARLQSWERSELRDRGQIELAMNAYFLEGIFPTDRAEAVLKAARCERLRSILAEMLAAKLHHDFPERKFAVVLLNDDEIGLSFHQM